MPAPRIVRRPDGRVLLDVGGSRVRVYEWVDLRPADRSLDPAAVGRVVANLHRVDHHGANGLDPWYTDPIGADAWHALARDLAAAAAPFATRFADRCDELIALEAVLEPQSRVQTCHRDLFADNLLATPSGDLCVIDWENSGLTDPSHELAVVLFEFAGTDGHRATLLADAYRDAGGPGLVDRPATFSMAIAQLGHIGQLSASRWLADADPAQRSRNRARVEEFLDDGITLAQIDLLLDAVGA